MDKHEDINAFITEDDPLFSAMLLDLLADNFPFVHIMGTASSIAEAKQFLAHNAIDLMFLDIELPDGKGFDLLTSMSEVNFEVIITTSQSIYAMDAIRHSALDYLMKPVSLAELERTITKFRKKYLVVRAEKNASPIVSKATFQKLPLPTAEGFVFVDVNEIICLEADRAYAVFTLKDGKKHMVSKPLGDFEERLYKHAFFRVHNSHIINLHEVKKYVRGEGGHVVMSNDAVVPVSRSRKDDFLNVIGF